MYPVVRLRRLRKTSWMRDLVAEHYILPKDLIQPFFIIEGTNKRESISTIPGIDRLSIDLMIEQAREAAMLGIKAIALFPCIEESLKDAAGSEALNKDNLICRAVEALKAANIDIGIICDIALDPYTDHRHDGILKDGDVDNDLSIKALEKQALTLASAGADIIAPSDMMDGRVGAIRSALDEAGYNKVAILSYSMKYISNLYGPFRDAVKSKIDGKELTKSTYQADYRVGYGQALQEVELDIAEGADMVMIKPAMFYLDIIRNISDIVAVPVFAFQVSGEYAMIKFSAQNGVLSNGVETMLEALTAIKRSGATGIFTYAAIEIARFLMEKQNGK
jgi:porphobilinogen synthase